MILRLLERPKKGGFFIDIFPLLTVSVFFVATFSMIKSMKFSFAMLLTFYYLILFPWAYSSFQKRSYRSNVELLL